MFFQWKLARKCNFEAGDKWYGHEPEGILENEDYKILWDFRRRYILPQEVLKRYLVGCQNWKF